MACVITLDGKKYDEAGFKQLLASGFLVDEINSGVLADSKSGIYKQYINGNGTQEATSGEAQQAATQGQEAQGAGTEAGQTTPGAETANQIPGFDQLTTAQQQEFNSAMDQINENLDKKISATEAFNKLMTYLGAENIPFIVDMKAAIQTSLNESRVKGILRSLEKAGKTQIKGKFARTKVGQTLLNLAGSMKSLGFNLAVLSDEDFDNFVKEAYGLSAAGQNAFYAWGPKTMVLRASNTSQIALHEFTHPLLEIIRQTNKAAYNALVKEVSDIDNQEGTLHPDGIKFFDWAQKNYDRGTMELLENEALTELVSVLADRRVSLSSPVGQAAYRVWNKIMAFFKLQATIDVKIDNTLTVDKLAKAISLAAITSRTIRVTDAAGINVVSRAGISSSKNRNLVFEAGINKYMTEDGEGNYVFYHRSNLDLTKKGIDPNKLGSNMRTGRDETMAKHPVSMYYTEPDIADVSGDYNHVVMIPKEKVYPADVDPLNLKPLAEKEFRKVFPNIAFDNNRAVSWIGKVAADKGYEMVVASWSPRRNFKALRAESVIKHKPKLFVKPSSGLGYSVDVNDKYDFTSNRKRRGISSSRTVKKEEQVPTEQKKITIDSSSLKTKERAGSRVGRGLSIKTQDKKKVKEEIEKLDLASVREAAPEVFIKNANIIKDYPLVAGVKKMKAATNVKQAQVIYDVFVDQVVDNLIFLMDNFNPKFKEIATLWYDGANVLANDFAKKYGVTTEQVAGIIAAMSPQKDWYQNVRLAELVLEAMDSNPMFTEDMVKRQDQVAAESLKELKKKVAKGTKTQADIDEALEASKKTRDKLLEFVGKRLNEIPEKFRPYVTRLSSEMTQSKEYPVLSPDGQILEPARKKDGTKKRVAWGSYTEIGKAVYIYLHPSQQDISFALGDMHKIRNFYNNIIDPMSKDGDVTIDTHAVAAALLLPLSGKSREVAQNFGSGNGVSNSATAGVKGLYYAYSEAYNKAAEKTGLLPRQVQSITWEAVRGLFTDKYKTNAENVKKIRDIFEDYKLGKITIDEARKRAIEEAGGIDDPTWGRFISPESTGDIREGSFGSKSGVSGSVPVGDTGPGGGRGVKPKKGISSSRSAVKFDEKKFNAEPVIEEMKSIPMESDGGATINLDGSKYEGGGLVVPIGSRNFKASELTKEAVVKFIEDNLGKISGDAYKFGFYKFEGQDKISVDINVVVDPKYKDLGLKFGKMAGQKSLFNLDTMQEDETGADGSNPMSFTDEQARAIGEAFSKGEFPSSVFGDAGTTDVNSKFAESAKLFDQIQEAEGSAKKRRLAEERRKLIESSPEVKFIDDNIKNIYEQLENKGVLKREGNCP